MTPYELVREFHARFGMPIRDVPDLDTVPMVERNLRCRLLGEELGELMKAERDSDIIGIAKELADVQYIVNGTALTYGIYLDPVFAAVHHSNMAKLLNGAPVKRADGKVLKPEGWKAPDVAGVLGIGV